MNMDIDMEYRPADPSALATGSHAPLDWHGLRARFAATYALRATLESAAPRPVAVEPADIDGGSFDRGSARALAVYGIAPGHGLGHVNPTGLADGNSGCDNAAAVAGTNSAGD